MEGLFWIDGVAVSGLGADVAAALAADSLGDALTAIAEQTRLLIGAHQSAVSYIPDGDFTRASHATSLSEKYAKYRTYDVMPTGKGIWAKIFEDGRAMRMNEAELHADPRFKKFSDLKDARGLEHPPMPGWLAVPVLRRSGAPIGLLQLSDRFEGDFTDADQTLLTAVATMISSTFELEYVHRQLIDSRRAYQELYDGSPDMYLAIDADTGCVRLCNQTAATRLGWSKDELVGKPILELYHPECHGDVQATLALVRAIGHVENVRLSVRTRAGDRIPVRLSARAVRAADGRVVYSVSSWRDVSDLEQAERMLEENNELLLRSNTELERFAYVASHDLQEPLRMVSSFTSLLAEDLGDALTERQRKWADFAVDGAVRMRGLIDGLLTYSKLGVSPPNPQPVALQEIVDEVEGVLAQHLADVGGRIEAQGLPSVRADRLQLYQVMQNLLSNGLRYRSDAPPVLQVTAEQSGDDWVVSVCDNGRGIDPSHHDKVFLMFQRLGREDSGSGIGLAIVKRAVEGFGGQVSVDSSLGHGATFHFTIPRGRHDG